MVSGRPTDNLHRICDSYLILELDEENDEETGVGMLIENRRNRLVPRSVFLEHIGTADREVVAPLAGYYGTMALSLQIPRPPKEPPPEPIPGRPPRRPPEPPEELPPREPDEIPPRREPDEVPPRREPPPSEPPPVKSLPCFTVG